MFPIRDDQPRYSTPYVNGFLIALNILVYLFQSSLDLQSYELFAMATQVAIYPHSNLPTVGASGAIAGVLGAYFILYPRARVLTWFFVFIFYVPAWIMLGYWFVLQFLAGAVTLSVAQKGRDVGGVAVWAHVGGFVAGLVMVKLFPERRRRTPYA